MDDNQIIQLFWKRDENAIQEQCETEDEVYDDETYIEETYTEETYTEEAYIEEAYGMSWSEENYRPVGTKIKIYCE